MEKKQLFNIENFVKENGNNNVRLMSFRWPRDLSLGTNKTKKVYTPNLNVVRNKNKNGVLPNLNRIDKKSPTKPNHIQRNKKPDQSKRFVQTASVFSEGTAEIRRATRYTDRTSGGRERDSVANMVLPKINRNSYKVNQNDEDVVISNLLADDESSESDEEYLYTPVIMKSNTFKDDSVYKTKVPLGKVKTEEAEIKPKMKNEFKFINGCADKLIGPAFLNNYSFSDSRPSLSLIKMPDSFAGKGGKGGMDNEDGANVDLTLDQTLEGKVGKLLIRRSGKMEFQMGQLTYSFEPVIHNPFAEEIMCLPPKDGNDIIQLGTVKEQYLVAPRWNGLVNKKT